MVGKGNVLKHHLGVVFIEAGPAAILALHGEDPGDRALAHIVLVAFPRVVVDLVQGQKHLGGIVGVGIKLVVELEIPAAGLRIPHLHRPVALVPHFLRQHPVGSLEQPRIGARNAGLAQRIDRISGIPHRRHAGLHAEGWLQEVGNPLVFDAQLLELIHGADGLRVVDRVAQTAQSENGVEHGRINRAQTVAHLQAFQDPLLRFPDGHLAQRPDMHPLGPVKEPVHYQEEVAPAQYLLAIPAEVKLGIRLPPTNSSSIPFSGASFLKGFLA